MSPVSTLRWFPALINGVLSSTWSVLHGACRHSGAVLCCCWPAITIHRLPAPRTAHPLTPLFPRSLAPVVLLCSAVLSILSNSLTRNRALVRHRGGAYHITLTWNCIHLLASPSNIPTSKIPYWSCTHSHTRTPWLRTGYSIPGCLSTLFRLFYRHPDFSSRLLSSPRSHLENKHHRSHSLCRLCLTPGRTVYGISRSLCHHG